MKQKVLLLLPLVLLAACESARTLRQTVLGATPHERYAASLREAGLHETALGRRWVDAGEQALSWPTPAVLPFHEVTFVSAVEPSAVAYRFHALRGQRVHVIVDANFDEPARVFIDLFEAPLPRDTNQRGSHVAAAEEGMLTLEYEPRRDTELLLRIHPELLRTVRVGVEVRTAPTLAFPVDGRDTRAVGSRFGVPRDGGSRVHHGVDIFAPHGTPVVAAGDGVVRRVGTNRLGGNVVWLSDYDRGVSHYYAHLDTQLVEAGMRVRVGDTLGLVGNTGNARTTRPHLHFGLYAGRGGPVDPWPFLYESPAAPARVTADTARLGGWSRSSAAESLNLRDAPGERGRVTARLARHTPLRVLGASGSWFRVELPDGSGGYVAAALTEGVQRPIGRQRFAAGASLLDRPGVGAVAMDTVRAGDSLPVLGRFAGYVMVEAGEGRTAWIAD